MSKQDFLNRPKYANLSHKQKEARWASYVESRRTVAGSKKSVPAIARGVNKLSVSPAAAALHLFPPCAVHYAQAMTSPFHLVESGANSACIPDIHAVPSKKVHTLAKFIMSTGTLGNGFIVVNPQCKTNDAAFSFTTSAAYPGGEVFPNLGLPSSPPVGTGVIASARIARLPYSDSEFQNGTSNGINGRVVGAGLRVRFIGAELARAGQLMVFRDSDNNHMLDGRSFDSVRNLETTKTYPVSKEWTYVNYRPVKPGEFEYSQWGCAGENPNQTSSSIGAFATYNMGFGISGTTTSGGTPGPAPFEWEYVLFIEYIGLVDQVSHTHSDIQAVSYIRNSLPVKNSTTNPHKLLAKTLDKIGTTILKHGSPSSVQSVQTSPSNQLLLSYRGNDRNPGTIMDRIGNSLSSGFENLVGQKLGQMIESGIGHALPYLEKVGIGAAELAAFAL